MEVRGKTLDVEVCEQIMPKSCSLQNEPLEVYMQTSEKNYMRKHKYWIKKHSED